MPTERKDPTVWEINHPGELIPSEEEFRQMRDRAVDSWTKRFQQEPWLLNAMRRQCDCYEPDSDDE